MNSAFALLTVHYLACFSLLVSTDTSTSNPELQKRYSTPPGIRRGSFIIESEKDNEIFDDELNYKPIMDEVIVFNKSDSSILMNKIYEAMRSQLISNQEDGVTASSISRGITPTPTIPPNIFNTATKPPTTTWSPFTTTSAPTRTTSPPFTTSPITTPTPQPTTSTTSLPPTTTESHYNIKVIFNLKCIKCNIKV